MVDLLPEDLNTQRLVEEALVVLVETLMLLMEVMEDLLFNFHQHLEIQYHNQDHLVVVLDFRDQVEVIFGLLVVVLAVDLVLEELEVLVQVEEVLMVGQEMVGLLHLMQLHLQGKILVQAVVVQTNHLELAAMVVLVSSSLHTHHKYSKNIQWA
jgi:hypothetical protein